MSSLPRLAAALACLTALPAQVDPELLAAMKPRSIGPAGMSGRVAAIDAVASQPNVIYVGAASGGLWKSVDGGLSFDPIFDDQPVASIGAIAINQRHPEIVWVGSGEGNPRNSASVGRGVFKSLDGGKTWRWLGLRDSERIHKIALHPDRPEVAWVAAMGRAWGESTERGVYKTTDGGETWERVLYVDPRTGCADLAIDPRNPDKLFAAMWDYRRKPWTFRSGGPGSGLYVSRDGGEQWKRLGAEAGMPKGELGRIGVGIAPSSPNVVYALVEAKKSALLRSDDGGSRFRVVNQEDNIAPRPFYYCRLCIDPVDEDRVYNIHSTVTYSIDGGKSFRQLIGWEIHPDHHAMWIHPDDPTFMIDGNDGGVAISRDHGESWRFVRNLPLAQYYHVNVDMETPYNVYGGLQDNGSWRGPSTVWENGGIRNHHWHELCFGDGFATLAEPTDASVGYAMSQQGYLRRWNFTTGEQKDIRPIGPEGVELRFNWNAGIALDPHTPGGVYFGSQFVHHSTDRGDSWRTISPDLTTNNPEWQKQAESGGLTYDVTGAENYTTILTIAPSPVRKGVVWVGTDDGRVQVTRDGGESWTSVEANVPGVPKNTYVPHVEASKFEVGTAFVVFDDHRRSNWTPYVFRTDDYGKTWHNLGSGSSLDGYVHVIEQDPVDPNLLFVGTEFGLWFSGNGGKAWTRWTHGFPTVAARALVVHPRDHDLVIGTHGRAAWVLDDIRPLRNLADAATQPVNLCEIAPAQQHRIRQTGGSRFPGATEFRGATRPYGALLNVWLDQPHLPHPNPEKKRTGKPAAAATVEASVAKEPEPKKKKPEPKAELVIEIRDAHGELVRELKQPAKLGLNRVVWNLRSKGFRRAGGRRGGRRGRSSGGSGPEVLPGTYSVTARCGEHESSQEVVVLADPREQIDMAARKAKWDAMQRAGKLGELAADAIGRIKKTGKRLDLVIDLAASDEKDDDGDETAADDADKGDAEKAAATKADADKGDAEKAAATKAAGSDKSGAADANDPRAALLAAAKKARKKLAAFEKDFGLVPDRRQGITRRQSFLRDVQSAGFSMRSSNDAPTPTQLEQLERGAAKLEKKLTALNELLTGEVAALRALIEKAEIELLPVPEPLPVSVDEK